MVELFYTTYISVHHAHHVIFLYKVGKDGINQSNYRTREFMKSNFKV